jgi:hypothetical protein
MDYKNQAIEAALVGACGYVGASLLGVTSTPVPFVGGINLPANVGVGIVCAGSDVVASLAQDSVLRLLPPNVEQSVVSIARPGLAGAGVYAYFTYAYGGANLINTVGLGAGASIAGQYAGNFVKNL